jgi:transcriptional regulator with XRE-family HTH domain
MDPRDALDKTIRLFKLNAKELADRSGVDAQMISKYRNKHRDMHSLNVFKVTQALPASAKGYFLSLMLFSEPTDTSKGKSLIDSDSKQVF